MISVIVPYYNGPDILPRCLDALAVQRGVAEFEVVVVDDSGTGEAGPLCEGKLAGKLRLIETGHAGQSAATNAGIRKAKGKYVLLFAQDMIASEGLLAAHVAVHAGMRADPLAVLGYMPYPYRGVADDFQEFLLSGAQFDFASLKDGDFCDPAKHFYAPNISLRRDFLLDNGLFDEELTYGFQDLELGWRLAQKGLKLVFRKECLAWHEHPMDLAEFCVKQEKLGRQAKVLHAKYPVFRETAQVEFWRTLLRHGAAVEEAKAFFGADGREGKEQALLRASRLLNRESELTLSSIRHILAQSAKMPQVYGHLSPVLYRLIVSFYFAQGYFS